MDELKTLANNAGLIQGRTIKDFFLPANIEGSYSENKMVDAYMHLGDGFLLAKVLLSWQILSIPQKS